MAKTEDLEYLTTMIDKIAYRKEELISIVKNLTNPGDITDPLISSIEEKLRALKTDYGHYFVALENFALGFAELHLMLAVVKPECKGEIIETIEKILGLTRNEFVRELYNGRLYLISELLVHIFNPSSEFVVQEAVVETMLNICKSETNKKAVPALIKDLESEKIEIRKKAAAALFELSSLASNKRLIGTSGALKVLVENLFPQPLKEVIDNLLILCKYDEQNIKLAVSFGAVEKTF